MCSDDASRVQSLGGNMHNNRSSSNSSSTSSNINTNSTYTIHHANPVLVQDRRALVTWIMQCSTFGSDVAGLYALDILSMCLYYAVRSGSAGTSNATTSASSGSGSGSGNSSVVNSTYDAEWVHHLHTALHTVYTKMCAGFVLTNR
jgi:hypothetical protein